MKSRKRFRLIIAPVIVLLSQALPSYAQVDLAGQWATRQHEDALERGGGPEVGCSPQQRKINQTAPSSAIHMPRYPGAS